MVHAPRELVNPGPHPRTLRRPPPLRGVRTSRGRGRATNVEAAKSEEDAKKIETKRSLGQTLTRVIVVGVGGEGIALASKKSSSDSGNVLYTLNYSKHSDQLEPMRLGAWIFQMTVNQT